MDASVTKSKVHTTTSKIGYGILGIIYAVVAYQIPVLVVGLVIASTNASDLIGASILIPIVAGILLSVIAYSTVSNQSLKSGMLVLYGLIIGPLFAMGGYTILASLTSL